MPSHLTTKKLIKAIIFLAALSTVSHAGSTSAVGMIEASILLNGYDCVVTEDHDSCRTGIRYSTDKSGFQFGVATNQEKGVARVFASSHDKNGLAKIFKSSDEFDIPGLKQRLITVDYVEKISDTQKILVFSEGSPSSPAIIKFEFLLKSSEWLLTTIHYQSYMGCISEDEIAIEHFVNFLNGTVTSLKLKNCKPQKKSTRHIPVARIDLSKFRFSLLDEALEKSGIR